MDSWGPGDAAYGSELPGLKSDLHRLRVFEPWIS